MSETTLKAIYQQKHNMLSFKLVPMIEEIEMVDN